MKKKIILICGFLLTIVITLFATLYFTKEKELVLPLPQVTGGERGMLGIDKNINEETIDKYLNMDNAVYRDVRMLKDPGNYEAIGGDSYLSGFVKGFEVISLPYIIPVSGLPEAVGKTYAGKTLFKIDTSGNYKPAYLESMDIIEYYFPKDKIIFLMCGGGGYAGMMKNFLVSLGWDQNKIYDVGGYWNYNGNNNVIIKRNNGKKDIYDFWKVNYHDIDFSKLTEVKK